MLLRQRAPRLAAMMDAFLDDVLAYMAVPREHWPANIEHKSDERLNGQFQAVEKRPSGHVEMFAPEQPRYGQLSIWKEAARWPIGKDPGHANAMRTDLGAHFPLTLRGRGCVGCAMACSDEFVSSKFDFRLAPPCLDHISDSGSRRLTTWRTAPKSMPERSSN